MFSACTSRFSTLVTISSFVYLSEVGDLCAVMMSSWHIEDSLTVGNAEYVLTPSGDVVFRLTSGDEWTLLSSGDIDGRMLAMGVDQSTVIAVGELGKVLRISVSNGELEIATVPRLLGDLYSVESAGGGVWKAVGADGARAVVLASQDDGRTWSFEDGFETVSLSRSPASGPKLDYFIDSLFGDDSNDGLTPSTSRRSISSLGDLGDNVTLYLARGSEWREQINLGRYGEIRAYGEGRKPVINAADVVNKQDFAEQDGYENVYRIMWRLEVGRIVLTETVQVFEDDIPLKWTDSLEECNSTPGSYFENGSLNSLVRAVYIHPSESSDIRSNTRTYEISKRDHAVKFGSDCSIFDVELKNNAHNDGSLSSWYQLYGARLALKNGTKHIALTRGDTFVKDSSLEHTNNRNRVSNAGQFVVYDQVLRPNEIVFLNTHFAQNRSYTREAYAFISHRGSSGENRIVSFADCSFENFKLAHAGITLESEGTNAWGGWFVRSSFFNCDRIWNSANQRGVHHYIDCYFDRLTPSNEADTILFTGAQDNGEANAGLVVRSSSFNTPKTRVLFGTFDHCTFSYNSVNGVNSNDPRFLATVDLYDGNGMSGSLFEFSHNHVSGYAKPWRFRSVGQFGDYDELLINHNYYTNSPGVGQYELSYTNMDFASWQAVTGNDLDSESGPIDDFQVLWFPEMRTPVLLNPMFEVGDDSGLLDGAAYEGSSLPNPTSFRSVLWHVGSSAWFAVGEREFGIRGCVYRSSDGVVWQEVSLPEGIPGLNVVGADAAGNIYAAGRSAVIVFSRDAGASFELIYRGASYDNITEFGSVGSGDCLFGGVNGLLLEYQNGQFYKRSLLSNKEAVSNIIVDNDHFLVSGEFGRDPMDYLQVKPLSVDLNIRDGGIAMQMKETERGHWYRVDSKAN